MGNVQKKLSIACIGVAASIPMPLYAATAMQSRLYVSALTPTVLIGTSVADRTSAPNPSMSGLQKISSSHLALVHSAGLTEMGMGEALYAQALGIGIRQNGDTTTAQEDSYKAASQPTDQAGEGEAELEQVRPEESQEDFIAIDLPFMLKETYLGDISAEVSLSGQAKISIDRLVILLGEHLGDDIREHLAQVKQTQGDQVALSNLTTDGFSLIYDSASLAIVAKMKKGGVQAISIQDNTSRKNPVEDSEAISSLSAGVTAILRPRYTHISTSDDEGIQPLQAELRGFVAVGGFKGVALSYQFDYDEQDDTKWRRDDITLTKDDFANAIRYQLGDIQPATSGFQSSVDLLGFSVQRNYSTIQPFRSLRSRGRTQFELENNALVSFEVNGIIVSTQELEPGFYDVRDFPFINGANDVRVLVEDELGKSEITNFSAYVDNELLPQGVSIFGLNVGARRERNATTTSTQRQYEDDIVGLGFFEYGLTQNLTVNSQFEVDADGGGLVAAGAVLGTGFGLLSFEGAASKNGDSEESYAGAVRYSWQSQDGMSAIIPDVNAQVLYQEGGFGTLGDYGDLRTEELNFTANSTWRIERSTVNLSGSWREVNSAKSNSVTASISRPFGKVSVSLAVQSNYSDREDERNNRVLLSVSRKFGPKGTLRARGATNPRDTEFEYRRSTSRNIGDIGARLALGSSNDVQTIQSELNYIHTRGEFDLRNETRSNEDTGSTTSSITRARLGVGIGYADGTFGVGRPIRNSFALFKRHTSLSDSNIKIRRNSSGPVSGVLSNNIPILIPLSGSYRSQKHVFEPETLPDGYDIGDAAISTFPPHHGGYAYTIGSDASNTAVGKMVYDTGEPLVFQVGKFLPVNNADIEPSDFFTNRNGRFVAERLSPGKYKIELARGKKIIGEVEIKSGAGGIIEMGTITVTTEEK